MLALIPLLFTACGPSFEPRVRVDGPFVLVGSYDFEEGDVVSAGGASGVVDDDFVNFKVEVPAESLGVGTHPLEIEVDRGGSVGRQTVEVTVTEANLATQLQLGPCDSMARGEEVILVKTTSPVWNYEYGKESDSCRVADGALTVPVRVNADATLTIGGAPVALEGGHGAWSGFSLGLLVSQTPLAQMDGPRDNNAPITVNVPVVVSRPGRDDERFEVEMTLPVRALRDHAQDQLQALTPGAAPTWTRSAHEGPARGLALAALGATVTVDGKERSAVPGGYWPVRALGPEGATADQVDLFALATPVDVTPNGSCNFNVNISGSGGLRNKLFDLGYEVVVVDAEGKEVARKTFPKPKKPSCPMSISGDGKETIVLWNPPQSEDVMAWLETVRAGQ